MSKRIFNGIFFVSLFVLLFVTVFIIGILYGYFSDQYSGSLMNEAVSLSFAVNSGGDDFLEDMKYDEYTHRITLIDSNGDVLFDNEANVSEMENHSNREEFIGAVKDGKATASRNSATLAEKTVYAAVLLKNGQVLRVSDTRLTPLSIVLGMLQPVIFLLCLILILSGLLASKISRSIVKPINEIDLDTPDKDKLYPELEPLVDKLNSQKDELDCKIVQLKHEHESQDKIRREFTANVSHELKTPLTSISGFAEIIRDGIVKEQDIRHFAGNIYDEAGRLITLVGDIIKISELDEGGGSVQKKPLDLYECSAAVVSRLASTADRAGVLMKLTGDHSEIIGAEQIVDEMIYNLCDNAIKYNNKGGFIKVEIKNSGDKAILSVEDNGIGISKEEQDRIFERFYRVNKSHSKEIGGTGLGLSIVKHGAIFHNAEIKITSALGEGTKISIVFNKNN